MGREGAVRRLEQEWDCETASRPHPQACRQMQPCFEITVRYDGLADGACSFGTSSESFELSVAGVMRLTALTSRVETSSSMLWDRRTREGTDRTL
jgi:hypothetical protein